MTTHLHENFDEIYDLAFAFKESKLWRKLWDTQLFAVRHSDGTIGYCCVMGRSGEFFALAVYPGEEGLASYRRLGSDEFAFDIFGECERTTAQNCVIVSFENKDEVDEVSMEEIRDYCQRSGKALRGAHAFPLFQRMRPGQYPWYIVDEADVTYIRETLQAALYVAQQLKGRSPEKLGFTEGVPFERSIPILTPTDGGYRWSLMNLPKPRKTVYPVCELGNDLLLARIKKAKKNRHTWAIRIFPSLEAVKPDGCEDDLRVAPFFPYLMLILDEDTEMIVGSGIEHSPGEYAIDFIKTLSDAVEENGQPRVIHVMDERTEQYLGDLAAKAGWRLVRQEENELLMEVTEEFADHFADDDLGISEEQLEIIDAFLRDPEGLRLLPDEMLGSMLELLDAGVLPDDAEEILVSEIMRRGMR